jgi:hypothetical protein
LPIGEGILSNDQLGVLLERLNGIRDSIDELKSKFADYKKDTNDRLDAVENETRQLNILTLKVNWILGLGTFVIGPTIAALVYALMKVIIK